MYESIHIVGLGTISYVRPKLIWTAIIIVLKLTTI